MGFFDVILKSIGFDVDDGEKKQKKAKKQKTEVAQKTQMSAKFNLSKPQQPEVKVERKQEEQPPPTENGGIMQTAYNLGSAVVNGASTVLSLANPFHYFGGANPEYRPKRRRRRRRY